MSIFLDPALCCELKDSLDKMENIWLKEDRNTFLLFNAIWDRLSDCIKYLNKNTALNDEDINSFQLFIMFSWTILDGIYMLCKELNITSNLNERLKTDCYFRSFIEKEPVLFPPQSIPNDKDFFRYFRSIVFAHTFETNQHKFLVNDTHYSPFVIVRKNYWFEGKSIDVVGVRIFSTKTSDTHDLLIPFDALKNYIKFRYSQLRLAIDKINDIHKQKIDEWKKNKVQRAEDPIDTLKSIQSILEERYVPSANLLEAIDILSCNLTESSNIYYVEQYRNEFKIAVPELSDYVDSMDYESFETCLTNLLEPLPIHKQQGRTNYQLSKIFCGLRTDSPSHAQSVGYGEVKNFSMGFASNWVKISPNDMTMSEIKLLVRVACYLESKKQQGNLL